MAKQGRSTGKMDAVMRVCHELRLQLEELFKRAADWAFQTFGQRIKHGAVMAAVAKYRRRRITPSWVGKFLRHLDTAPAV